MNVADLRIRKLRIEADPDQEDPEFRTEFREETVLGIEERNDAV